MWIATWRQPHATELMFHQKMRSVHRAEQQNLKRAHKASQRQNTSHSIVAGANRRQRGHILDDRGENCMDQLERGHLPTPLRGSLSPEATQVLTMAHMKSHLRDLCAFDQWTRPSTFAGSTNIVDTRLRRPIIAKTTLLRRLLNISQPHIHLHSPTSCMSYQVDIRTLQCSKLKVCSLKTTMFNR